MLSILAAVAVLQPQVRIPDGSVAILDPIVDKGVFFEERHRADPFALSERANARVARESRGWKGWRVRFVDVNRTRDLQRSVFGPRSEWTTLSNRTRLSTIAGRLSARYLIVYRIGELAGARTSGFGARTTGRASIDLSVWEAATERFVWTSRITETSSAASTRVAMEPRMEQALINAIRVACDPFFADGMRVEIR